MGGPMEWIFVLLFAILFGAACAAYAIVHRLGALTSAVREVLAAHGAPMPEEPSKPRLLAPVDRTLKTFRRSH